MALLDKLKAVVKAVQEPQNGYVQTQPTNDCIFCARCGSKLPLNVAFCNNCGAHTSNTMVPEPTPPPVFFENTKAEPLRKCLNCGENLKGTEKECPACGFQLPKAGNISGVAELSKHLTYAKTEGQRISLIKTFPVPNDKEEIIEFMILASSNFDADYHAAHVNEDDISDAWLSKIEQCYQKANANFKSDPDFVNIEETYKNVHRRIEKADTERGGITEKSSWKEIIIYRQKRKLQEQRGAMVGGLIGLAVLLLICIPLTICGVLGVFDSPDPYADDPSAIKVGYSASELEGQHYQDVVKLLESKGFTNIEAREDGWNLFKKEGTVKKITIDGKDSFYDSSRFPPSVIIIIFYYK